MSNNQTLNANEQPVLYMWLYYWWKGHCFPGHLICDLKFTAMKAGDDKLILQNASDNILWYIYRDAFFVQVCHIYYFVNKEL